MTAFDLAGTLLVEAFAGATAILLVAAAVVTLSRKQSAAFRHRVWALSTAAVLILPVLLVLLPNLGPDWQSLAFDPRTLTGATPQLSPESSASPGELNQAMQGAVPGEAGGWREGRRFGSLASGEDSELLTEHAGILLENRAVESQVDSSRKDRLSTSRGLDGTSGPVERDQSQVRLSAYTLVAIWLLGVIRGLLFFVRRQVSAMFLVRRAFPVDDSGIVTMKAQLATSAGIRSNISLLYSSEISVPVATGCLRPLLIVPVDYRDWSTERCRVVLAHELAHIRRQDLRFQLVAQLACILYWCHPLVWIANWRMRVEREFACDDAVLEKGESPARYANHLVDVAAALLDRPCPSLNAVAMASGSTLEHRVRGILTPYTKRNAVTPRTGGVLLSGATAIVVMLSLMSPSKSQEDLSEKKNTPAVNYESKTTSEGSTSANDGTKSPAGGGSSTVRGIAVDGSGQPVSGASVAINLGAETLIERTGVDGSFAMEIPFDRVRGVAPLMFASGPDGTLGFAELPWEFIPPWMQPAENIPRQRIQLKPPRQIEVKVVDRQDDPVERAKVVVTSHYRPVDQATADKEGWATLAVPQGLMLQLVLADAGAEGIDYVSFQQANKPYQLPQDHNEPIVLTLSPTRPLTVRAIDENGNPVEGARISPWYVTLSEKGENAHLGLLWAKYTDLDGKVTYNSIPLENQGKLGIWVRKDGYVAQERTVIDPRSADQEVVARLLPLVPVTGRVLHPDGSPAAGIKVHAAGDRYGIDDYSATTSTAEDGSFRFDVHPNSFCMFQAVSEEWASKTETRTVLLGKPLRGLDLKLRPATRIFGRVTAGATLRPLENEEVQLHHIFGEKGEAYYQLPEEERLPAPAEVDPTINPRYYRISPDLVRITHTDHEARFEFYVGPGDYYIIMPRHDVERVDGERLLFRIDEQQELEVDLWAKP